MLLAFCAAFALALSPPAGTAIPNAATARFAGTNGHVFPAVSSNTVETVVGGAPVLTITAVAAPDPTAPGGTLTYTMTVANTGNLPATAVTAAAILSPVLQFQGASNGGTASPPLVTWSLGVIAPGGSVTFTLTAVVAAGTPPETVIPFTASTTCREGSTDDTSLDTRVGLGPHLILEKSAAVPSVAAGGRIDYTIRYTNIGNQIARHVVIRDALPAETALASGSIAAGGTVADRAITWHIDSLAPGGSGTVSFSVMVSPLASAGSVIINTAVVSSDQTAVVTSNEVRIPVILQNILPPSAAKRFTPDIVAPGGSADLTITLTNSNAQAMTGAAFTDAYPTGMANAAAAPTTNTCGGTVTMAQNGASLTLTGGTIPASGSCSVVVPVKAGAPGTYTNTTGAVTTENGGAGSPASAVLTVTAPPTAAKRFDPSSVAVGENTLLTITLTNSNAYAITGAAFTDVYPAGMANAAAAPTTNTCGGTVTMAQNGVSLALTGGTIPASGSCSVVVPVAVAAAGTYTNNTGPITAENTGAGAAASAALTAAPGVASLTLAKTAPAVKVYAGAQIAFTLTVANTGNSKVTGIFIDDPLPAGLTFVGADVPAIVTAGTVRLAIGELSVGQTKAAQLTVAVDKTGTAGKDITNKASTVSVEAPAVSASAVLSVSAPQLSLLKTATTEIARPGNTLTYAIVLKNEGDIPAYGVVVQDTLPAGASFVSADNGGTLQGETVRWTIPSVAPAASVTLRLTVLIDKAYSEPAISNTARATVEGTAGLSSTAVKTITVRTPGQVAFSDEAWQPVYAYNSGKTIYVQVTDLDQSGNSSAAAKAAAAGTVNAVLTDPATGDTETVQLAEIASTPGVFRGAIPSTLSSTPSENGVLTVAANSRIHVTYTDPLDAEPVSRDSALIDPAGVVFDSMTGTPAANAVVALRNWNSTTNSCDLASWPSLPPGQINPAPPTGADGRFAFPLAPAGDYCFQVTPPANYTFPSVVADADLPPGYNIGKASRGDKFTLTAGEPPLIADIPLDPPAGRLSIAKTANKTTAAVGDLILYTVTLTNNGASPVTQLAVTDVMPHGIAYLSGSTQIDGKAAADPERTGGGTMIWRISALAPQKSVAITYRAVVGPDAKSGTGINTVVASGMSLGKKVSSNSAFVKIKITEGVFTTKGTIIGHVFIDRDGDGSPKAKNGVADVALYLEDGTRVLTDKSGKFSITGVAPGTHVLRLDETSLPKGLAPKPISNRFMGDGASQFVDMTPHGLIKANFALDKTADYQETPAAPAKDAPALKSKPEAGKQLALVEPVPAAEAPRKESPAADSKAAAPEAAFPAPPATGGQSKATAPGVLQTGSALPAAPEKTGAAAASPAVTAPVTVTTPAPQTSAPPTPPSSAPVPSGPADASAATKEEELPLEKQILTMTPELAILKPHDQAATSRRSIRVLVKAPADTVLTLSVNGEKVDNRQIGMQIKNARGRVALYEFIDVHLRAGGENILRAEARDPFGNVRGEKEIRISTVGEAAKITVVPEAREAQADGKTRTGVTVSVTDKNGRPVGEVSFITAAVTMGEILEKDADPAADGHQVPCRDGVARFTVVSPRETGEAQILAQVNDVTESAGIFFMPHLRPMFLVGVGEIVLGHGRTSGDTSYLQDRTFFGDGAYLKGRGAFFLKGNLYKDFLLTAAFDSNKKQSDELFRESDTRLDGEDKYPVYGDESKTGYEALSRDNLYVKLEKGKSSLMYGDYRTDLTDTKLAAYSRSFNGLKLDINTDKLRVRSFGSYTDQTQVVDTTPGRGISGLYYLTNSQIVEGTERVVIETRDRLQPDRILARDIKSRGSDYEIDYGMGTLLFKAPVPSHDADGNPLYIVTTYECRTEGKKYLIYGGRGAFKITNWLEVGATGILEEKAVSNYELFGGDMTLKLPGKTVVKAEYVHTRSLFDIDNAWQAKPGEGWSVELESRPFAKLSVTGFYRELNDYFSNPSATDAVRGTRKFGFDAAYEIAEGLNLKAKYLDERDRVNDSSHRLASVGAVKKFTKTSISAELSHETAENVTPTPAQTPFTPGGLLNGVPFMNAYELPKRATFAKLALEHELFSKLSVSVSHKQDLGSEGYFVSQAGLIYQVNKQNRLYIREEFARYQDGKQTRTLIGAESQVIKNTTAYQEFRLADGSAGHRNQQVIGLKNKLTLTKGLTTNIAAEYLSTLSGQKNANEPDAYAVAGSLEYLPDDNLKLTGRMEHRHEIVENGTDAYLAEVGAAYKLHPDFSLLLRERYFLEKKHGTGENHTSRLMAGVAYRPLDFDRFNALTKIEYKYDKRTAGQPANKTDSFILSTEGHYQFSPGLQLTGKYAGKLEKEESFSSYTDLIAARILWDLTDRFDVGLEYRLLTNHATQTRLHGGAAELGYRVYKNLWLSAGYSFDKFDADLAGDSYQGQGPYMKLRFKFDEKTLQGIHRALPGGRDARTARPE